MIVREILETTLFKTCLIRREIVAIGDDDPGTEWKAAYSLVDGSYIGDCDSANYFEKKGIIPQAIPGSGNKVSSIGFCKEEQKFFGWSHRAIYGFGIGSRVKRGDCAYKPVDPQDMLDDMIRFWVDGEDEYVTETEITKTAVGVPDPYQNREGPGVLLETRHVRKKDGEVLNSTHWSPYPDEWGRGEWEAKTLDDAMEMAIAFAEDVS